MQDEWLHVCVNQHTQILQLLVWLKIGLLPLDDCSQVLAQLEKILMESVEAKVEQRRVVLSEDQSISSPREVHSLD